MVKRPGPLPWPQRAARSGAFGEDGAVFGFVAELDAFAFARQDHGVFADDSAAAQTGEADGAGGARAFDAVVRLGAQIGGLRLRPAAAASPSSSAVPEARRVLGLSSLPRKSSVPTTTSKFWKCIMA